MKKVEYLLMSEVERTHWWFVARRRFVSEVFAHMKLDRIDHARTIVDVGSGTGGMIPMLSGYGSVIGFEPNAYARLLAQKKHIRLRAGFAEHLPIHSRSADIVTIFDVLYHMGVDQEQALQEAKRVLKSGGKLIITDCAIPLLYGPHDRALDGRERYTIRKMASLLENSGFQVVYRSYLFFLIFPLFFLKRMWSKLRGSARGSSEVAGVWPLANTVLGILCDLEASLLRWVRFAWGSTLVIVAIKS